MKKLLEEAEVEKASLKKKVVEWKYDKMKKRANEWADKFKLRETDNTVIQELWGSSSRRRKTKWRSGGRK